MKYSKKQAPTEPTTEEVQADIQILNIDVDETEEEKEDAEED
jgi:hypothetical protein